MKRCVGVPLIFSEKKRKLKGMAKNVDNEMLCPLSQSVTIFKLVMNCKSKLLYADIVKSTGGQETGGAPPPL